MKKCVSHLFVKTKKYFFHFSDPFSAFLSALPENENYLSNFFQVEKLGHEHAF